MKLNELIEEKLKETATVKKFIENQNALPDGKLRVISINGTFRYYQRTSKENQNGKYLDKSCSETIKSLEQKEYLIELKKKVEEEEEILLKMRELAKKMPDYKSVFLEIPSQKRHLIEPYVYADQEQLARKASWEKNKKKKYKETHLDWDCNIANKFLTKNGEYVRSKSELIIADRLKDADVPYYYESALVVEYAKDGPLSKWNPDFRVLNTRTGHEMVWEHFGLLDNPDYCNSCQTKLEIYAENGYYLGDNLIVTTESTKHPLNIKYIDNIINRYFK